jgi:predicted DNA-binding ribbon-helix-helix protein
MGRKRKISSGAILTVYLTSEQYNQLSQLARQMNKSISELVREILDSILKQHEQQDDNGDIYSELNEMKKQLIYSDLKEKLQLIRNLSMKLKQYQEYDKQAFQYYQLRETTKKQVLELIDMINRNRITDQNLINEVRNTITSIPIK